jgi:hypothetical protein
MANGRDELSYTCSINSVVKREYYSPYPMWADSSCGTKLVSRVQGVNQPRVVPEATHGQSYDSGASRTLMIKYNLHRTLYGRLYSHLG